MSTASCEANVRRFGSTHGVICTLEPKEDGHTVTYDGVRGGCR